MRPPRCACALLLVTVALVGCQPRNDPQVVVSNDTGHHYTLYVQRAGQERFSIGTVAPHRDALYQSPDIYNRGCEEAKIIAVRDDGSSAESGPPICKDRTIKLSALTG